VLTSGKFVFVASPLSTQH